MVKIRIQIFFTILFFFLKSASLMAQGTINVPAKECLGNITSFSYTPPSGLTLSSASWNFGDGFTSSSNTPIHTYGSIGKFTIVIQATFTNSTTKVDSVKIEVFGLPQVAFYFDQKSDTCFTRNRVCYVDTSKPAVPGQSITNRLFVWGDGTFSTMSNPPFGQKLCHNYAVSDRYDIKMEVTDKIGCKNSASAVINVVENVQPIVSYVNPHFIDCNTFELCFKNESAPVNPKTAHYEWHIDTFKVDTLPYLTSLKCSRFKKSKNITVSLIAYANNNCRDTQSFPYNIVVDSLPTKLELLDTVRCFSNDALNEAFFKPAANDEINWYFDNAYDRFKKGAHVYFGTKMFPGIHQVKAEIIRGSCTHVITANYRILGPLARMRIIDADQCFSNREVFFVEESMGTNRNNCLFRWNIMDTFGGKCTTNRSKDINKYMNCNTALDWYTKHKFNGKLKSIYQATLWVKDTINGCEDSIEYNVNMAYCSKLLDKDSIDVCRNAIFVEDIPPPYPIEFTVDSVNQVWKKFPGTIDSTFKKDIYDVGLRFKTLISPWAENYGDDSIKIHKDTVIFYDTVYLKKYLHIREPKSDSVYLKVYGNCRPFRVSVHFKKGQFYKNDYLYVAWGGGDSSNFEKTFVKDEIMDSVFGTFNSTGIQTEIRVEMSNMYGCKSNYRLPLNRGKTLFTNVSKNTCINIKTCFTPYIYDIPRQGFWTENNSVHHVSYWIDDTSAIVDRYNPCYNFKTGGKHFFKMIVKDSFGCQDTLSDSLFVQDPHANAKYHAKFLYCSELKQFFDSSSVINNPQDSIKKYLWQFGSGVFSSLQKNPLQSINTSLEKISAAHAIETVFGCVDTFRFEIQIIGPKPYFKIKDTIGCGSLNAIFTNLSKNCKQYIWQYGDSAQTTYQTFSQAPVNFLYNKPGRYHISLVGIDTVFNPFTNAMQSCFSTFPDKLFQKDTVRSVLVLPLYRTGIVSKDTICLGSAARFDSKSDTGYNYDLWQMGDTSAAFKLPEGTSHNYQYQKQGLYTVKLKPGFNTAINNLCRDSAQKTILVLGVQADFDIDPNNVAPIFLFHNKSNPNGASINWNFGQAGSGASNSSSENDPSHNYDKDTGTFNVCLIAKLPYGCADTVCKTIFNDHQESFGIYNVFTPGLIDGKNDQYDIQIEGEDFYELLIYDRWGKLVFEGKEDADNTQNINWNGKVFNHGPECPSGTYYYLFRYKLKQSSEGIKTLNGVITLIR